MRLATALALLVAAGTAARWCRTPNRGQRHADRGIRPPAARADGTPVTVVDRYLNLLGYDVRRWDSRQHGGEEEVGVKVDVNPLSLRSLKQALEAYESRFGVPSRDMRKAFVVDGRLQETSDLRDWSRLYRTYSAAQATLKKRRAA